MTPRARRAYEFGANVMDSRFNSPTYASRLHKYGLRGFAVVVPGLDESRISQQLLSKSHIYIEDHDLLLEITSLGRRGSAESVVKFADRSARIRYERCGEGKDVDGLAKFVVADRGRVRSARLPRMETCEKSSVITAELAAETGSPIMLHSGVPMIYHLLWGADVPELTLPNSDSETEDACEDLSGYACTPLARAYDLLSHLLDQQILEQPDGHMKSGMVSRLSARIVKQNGEVSAATCLRHYHRSLTCKRKIQFVWDLAACHAEFDSLAGILDATTIPGILDMQGRWVTECGVPKLLSEAIVAAVPRRPTEIDWFRGIY